MKINKTVVPNLTFGLLDSNKSFKLGMVRKRVFNNNFGNGEEMVDRVSKQRAWGDVKRRHIVLIGVEMSQA